jgi:hypothetical protein
MCLKIEKKHISLSIFLITNEFCEKNLNISDLFLRKKYHNTISELIQIDMYLQYFSLHN